MSRIESRPQGPRAATFLRVRALWLSPLILGGIVVSLMSLTYIGALTDPAAHLHDLPVAVVVQDSGATVGAASVDLGRELATALADSSGVADQLSLMELDQNAANDGMDRGELYASVVIPASFSSDLVALVDPAAEPAAGAASVQLVTNPRLGSAGTGLATGVLTPALETAAAQIGATLSTLAPASSADAQSAALTRALQTPFAVTNSQHDPLPSHSALGLSAFYLALLATMCGFLGATLVNSTVDSALGYATTETGSRWRQRAPVPITRWQTLLTKWAIVGVIAPTFVGVVLLIAVGILGLDAPNVLGLWALMSLSAITIAAGTLALFTALGSLGQLLALVLFVYLALASSGATVPVQALPEPFATISRVDPLHQAFVGIRSIVYFDGRATDGWPQAVLVLGIALAFWLALGAAAALWYDRRGLARLSPDLIAYVTRTAAAYERPKITP